MKTAHLDTTKLWLRCTGPRTDRLGKKDMHRAERKEREEHIFHEHRAWLDTTPCDRTPLTRP